ncbi:Uncharacterised protein [Mycobacteroides abscessus subsp. abscessus]|nr:Uncharacterised protein [Mycobacteroides abscessus subsp. abscessus]
MSDRNAFRRPGRARGVDDVGDVVGLRAGFGRPVVGPVERLPHIDDHTVEAVEPIGQGRGGDGGERCGIVQHEGDSGRRQCRVDRQVGRAGLEHAQDGHDGLGGTRQHHRDAAPRTRAAIGEKLSHAIRRAVELPVGQWPTVTAERHRLRHASHLSGEQCRDRRRQSRFGGERRPVSELRQPVLGRCTEHRQRRQTLRRVRRHGGQHAVELVRQFHDVELPGTERRDGEFVARTRERQSRTASETGDQLRCRGGLAQRHGESRRQKVHHDPVRTRPVDLALQGLNGKSLMAHRFSGAGVHMRTEFGDGGVRRNLQHQRHHAGDHAGQRLRHLEHAPRHRQVEHDLVPLGRPATQDQCARRDEHRGPAHVPGRTQSFDLCQQRGGERDRLRRAVCARDVIRRQVTSRLRRQVRGPVGLVLGVVRGGFVCIFGVQQILQRTEVGRLNRHARNGFRVDRRDALQDQCQPDAVGDDVVAAGEEVGLVGAGPEVGEPQQRAIQRHGGALQRRGRRTRIGHRLVGIGQIMERHLEIGDVEQPLAHLTAGLRERRPHRVGLAHDVADRLLEDLEINRTVNFYEDTELPLRSRLTGFLREPDVQLPTRDRQRRIAEIHPKH